MTARLGLTPHCVAIELSDRCATVTSSPGPATVLATRGPTGPSIIRIRRRRQGRFPLQHNALASGVGSAAGRRSQAAEEGFARGAGPVRQRPGRGLTAPAVRALGWCGRGVVPPDHVNLDELRHSHPDGLLSTAPVAAGLPMSAVVSIARTDSPSLRPQAVRAASRPKDKGDTLHALGANVPKRPRQATHPRHSFTTTGTPRYAGVGTATCGRSVGPGARRDGPGSRRWKPAYAGDLRPRGRS